MLGNTDLRRTLTIERSSESACIGQGRVSANQDVGAALTYLAAARLSCGWGQVKCEKYGRAGWFKKKSKNMKSALILKAMERNWNIF